MAKQKGDIVQLISNFQRKMVNKKPSVVKMFEEIRMMRFKIRPLQGDISILNLKNKGFIEILWSLGKLDEFFQRQYKKISSRDRDLFLRLFDEMHDSFQNKLNALNLKPERVHESSQTFEMEIFKEKRKRVN